MDTNKDKTLENTLDILSLKNEVNLVTMAINRLDKNMEESEQTLKEINKGIQDINLKLTSIEAIDKRVVTLEGKVDEIESLPNKILWRFTVGFVALSIAAIGWALKGG